MAAIQENGWASKLFSSALFCLWLSIASVTVWFDLPEQTPPPAAELHSASTPEDAIPDSDRYADAA